MAKRTWGDVFREIEKVVLFIESGEYIKCYGKKLKDIRKDYDSIHTFHVDALNFGLKKYIRSGNIIKTRDFKGSITLLNLKRKLKDQFILYPNGNNSENGDEE